MIFDVLTIFPDLFGPFINQSLIGKARKRRLIDINLHNLRDYCPDKHRQVDDTPYGGGPGMVLKPEPLFRAVERIKQEADWGKEKNRVVLLSPKGTPLNHRQVEKLAELDRLLLICGRYEGVDERVQVLVDENISIGDYVLNGGELAAMVVIESTCRLIPGFLGKRESAEHESFADGLLDFPHYTKPANYQGYKVPEVLLNGNHAQIAIWRRQSALRKTWENRPDLLEKTDKNRLSEEDRRYLQLLLDIK